MDNNYLQRALQTFNDTNGVNWYGWKTHDDNGNKIPNSERMQYKYIKIIKEGATIPSESDVNAKIQELKGTNSTSSNYEKQRRNAYPSIGDQLDMLWHTMDKNTELQHKFYDFYQTIKKVKVAHPKK